MKTLQSPVLRGITPASLITDPEISALTECLDPQLNQISQCAYEALILPRIDELPEEVLDLLAWQMHCDFYDLAYSLEIKRRTIKGSIKWHMKKGTVSAIYEALHLIDIDAKFTNWPEFGGEPYTFMISAVVAGDFYRTRGKDRLAFSVRRAVNESKAARSLMVKLDIHIRPKESTGLYAGFVWARNYDINLGLEKKQMHELLIMFEKRIIDKLESYGERFTEQMASLSQNLIRKMTEKEIEISDRINECESSTLRRIAEYERETARRIQGYEDRVMIRLNKYERTLFERLSELSEEVRELRESLIWRGAERDEREGGLRK